MAFGILNCKRSEHVPGTARLNDQANLAQELNDVPAEFLKHGTGRYSHVILVPQPSDSPNDPLNWPLWKKDMILVIVGFSAAVVGAYGPMLSPGFVPIAATLGITVEKLAQATAWLILTIGLSLFLANPAAKVYGKRPVYIVAIVILFVASVWGAVTEEYNSFLGSRIIGGFGMAPYEVLVQCTIGDMYFVHQRATRIAFWNLFLLCGISGGALVAGYIIEALGYRWTFGFCAILFGVLVFLVIFFVPETSYRRDCPVTMEQSARDLEKVEMRGEKQNMAHVSTSVTHTSLSEPKTSYWKSLRIFSGRYSDAPFWKVLVRPFVVFWYPAVFWGFLVYGTTLTWIVVFSVVNGVIFFEPPYNFNVSQIGLISLSPLVCSLIGELISGPLNDWICLKLAKRNHGVYEPEFRLVLMSLVAVLGAVGFFGFGLTIHYQTHWAGPVLTFGLANMSLAFASTCVFGYILDSHANLAEEAFVAVNARNLLTFGLIYFVNTWLVESGVLSVFCVLGALFLFVCFLTIPLWVFGKRIRSSIARTHWLDKFMTDK